MNSFKFKEKGGMTEQFSTQKKSWKRGDRVWG